MMNADRCFDKMVTMRMKDVKSALDIKKVSLC